MKTLAFLLFCPLALSAQIDNNSYHQRQHTYSAPDHEISGNAQSMTIVTEVIYNAVPDGYHITYTSSFIGNSVEDVEYRMNKKMDSLARRVAGLKLSRKDVTVDVIALDPIFDFRQSDSAAPDGYKVTQNITFNIPDIHVIGELSRVCLDFGIYDLIDAQAYVLDSKPIYDSIDRKTVELLDLKKRLCKDVGIPLESSKVSMTKVKDVYYPSERYLKSYLESATLYKHHVTQNSQLSLSRRVDIDNYYDFNLKNADFVFNAGNDVPVVQFFCRLVTVYTKVDTEEEMREKIRKEMEDKKERKLFIMDENGEIRKMEL